ncbi:MAG: endo-1,4-beta-xylanase [Clostridiales bacterium]|jgi:GH35 family endo-1,4-beta-xylanase|nr:endo-1,4-beta-xylanase [Clostridiales bacterium]
MKTRFAVLIFTFLFLALAACGVNEDENSYVIDETEAPVETPAPTATPEPVATPEPTPDPAMVFTAAEGSVSLRVETMGNQQWDGTQVPTAVLGIELDKIYEFSFNLFTPMAENDLSIGMLLQTNGPLWRHIAYSDIYSPEDEPEWRTVRGILDLTGLTSLPEFIQIVKNGGGPNPNANVAFYIDNFTVTLDGEEIAYFNFENDDAAPFVQSGTSLILTGTASANSAGIPTPEWDMTLPSLAEAYADYFFIGNIIEPQQIRDNMNGVIDMFLYHYNSVTAENVMKVAAVGGGENQRTRPDSLNLAGARAVVEFAEQNNLYMVGHTLLWHSQSSPWLYRDSQTGEYLTRAEAMENMRWFIQQYAGEFEGRIDAWDVANEAFTNGGSANVPREGPADYPVYDIGTWQRALRNESPWYHAFANGADLEAGESAADYIYYAFVFARLYAPSSVLIYNDFNEESPHKRDAMASMVEDLNERWYNDSENNPAAGNPAHAEYGRLLIEAIGMQAHYNRNTNMENIRLALQRFSETGARIHVTELDIHFREAVPAPFTMTDAQLTRQGDMFAQLFEWYIEYADYIDRVTIWGREDSTSWRGDGAATHFDRFWQPKPAFWAMIDPTGER